MICSGPPRLCNWGFPALTAAARRPLTAGRFCPLDNQKPSFDDVSIVRAHSVALKLPAVFKLEDCKALQPETENSIEVSAIAFVEKGIPMHGKRVRGYMTELWGVTNRNTADNQRDKFNQLVK